MHSVDDRIGQLVLEDQMKEWIQYNSGQEEVVQERFFDLKLTSGEVVLECYPSKRTGCIWYSPSGKCYLGSEVAAVRETNFIKEG